MNQKVDVKLPCESDNYDWKKQFDRPLLHKRIAPKKINKPTRRQYGDEWTTKVALLYNHTRGTIAMMAKELGISESTVWRLKNRAVEQGLIKEDEGMNILRKDQVEMVEKAKEADTIDDLVQGFVDAEQEAKELLELIGKYKQAAVACAETLGAEGKPILDKIWEQLSIQTGKILPLDNAV